MLSVKQAVQTFFRRAPCIYESIVKNKCKTVFIIKLKNIGANTDICNVPDLSLDVLYERGFSKSFW